MNEDIARERSRTTFNVDELSNFLYEGPENVKALKKFEEVILNDPVYDNSKAYFMYDEEAYEDALRKVTHFLTKRKELGFDKLPSTVQLFVSGLVAPLNPFGLHETMFRTIIKSQGNEKQCAKWIPLIDDYKILGTYAQTEMGHGTFIRGLETTATYNPRSQTFVLNTPTLSSTKWWPGTLGHTSTHAVVMARLITLGKDHGIHAFIVQLRSLEDHCVLPGRKVGLIGPKMAYKIIDNGYLMLNNVEVPRENMLMRYSQVMPDGQYSKTRGSEKLTYVSMVGVRTYLVYASAYQLGKACTIAIRYSAVRRQSKLNESKPELQILDYKTQQYALFPLLATTYAFWTTSFQMKKMYVDVQKEISEGNLSNALELHATSAGLKAFTSQTTATGVETCRFRCGGHGYSMSSGLPSIYLDFAAPACSYEGENIVMLLQTARYLVKCCSKLASGKSVSTSVAGYLSAIAKDTKCLASAPQDFRNPALLTQAFQHRAARLVVLGSRKLQEKVSNGMSPEDAWNSVSVDLVRAAKAHCHFYVMKQFAKSLTKENFSVELYSVLKTLFDLYAVYGIVENAKDFLEDQYMSGKQINLANDVVMELLDELRPDTVALVDAFRFSDHELNSVLGRYDGNVYEHLMKWAERYQMNRQEILPAYEKYLRPLLKGELAAKL